jgi:imidazolonepropionase-like amidohydrolase
MTRLFILFSLFLLATNSFSQLAPSNGVADSKVVYYALQHVNVYVSSTELVENATVLIKGNKIEKIGKLINLPNGCVEIDMEGQTIIPSFIELYTNIALPKPTSSAGFRPQIESAKQGAYYWNESIHPELDAATLFQIDSKANENFISMGFGFAVTHVQDGIVRGSGALISLGNENVNKQLISSHAGNFYSFSKGISSQSYPSSQMGAIALLRQSLCDLSYYQNNKLNQEKSISLDSWAKHLHGPSFFKVDEKWEILRANKISKEFGLDFIYIASGNEYANVNELKKILPKLIVPMNFPLAYDVQDPYLARQIPLSDLKHWELAPYNPKFLIDNGLTVALTSSGIESPKTFWKNIRKQVEIGLSVQQILEALTEIPAKMIGQEALIGSLQDGKLASFNVFDGNPFDAEVTLLESWQLGERRILTTPQKNNLLGDFTLMIKGKKYELQVSGSKEKPSGKVSYTQEKIVKKKTVVDTISSDVTITINQADISMAFNFPSENKTGGFQLHGKIKRKGEIIEGDALLPDGNWSEWAAIKKQKKSNKVDEEKTNANETIEEPKSWLPNLAFGRNAELVDRPLVIKNTTLWTNEAEGIMENATVVCFDGKIIIVSKNNVVIPPNAIIIDGKGMHLTSGIIDEHSHIAISKGVNEGGQTITAEVSIADVVNPDDINIYRQLAGGVTAAQLLHGSANTIGGQSALIKLKWGSSPDEMIIPNAPKFIKCALGENVKQSNWGDYSTVRFPQTRMGVEQVFYDGFVRAAAYKKEWNTFLLSKKTENSITPRKDLELEVLCEILSGERKITCHSYVQSEINMLMKVADSMGFTVNTFTHILEGYKLADKMKEHGVGASTFSDWWAYKFEVNDAIPYNAALMNQQGLVVAINSDDAEMGRRLNQEAAKSVKYGGMSEIDAWKMVTLNPSKLLHLDDRMGSVRVGKDADLVLWSDNPLSINAIVQMTVIDGKILFSLEEDKLSQSRNKVERARLTSLMLSQNKSNGDTQKFKPKRNKHFHCNTIGEEGSELENSH